MKMDSLDSLTHGGVRGRNFSSRRNSSYSIAESGDLIKVCTYMWTICYTMDDLLHFLK